MTDYGRGSGSEPWHPEDPLFGDQRDDHQQYQQPQAGWDPYATGQQPRYPYGDRPAPQQYPQQQYAQDPYATWDTGAHVAYGTGAGDPYGGQQPVDPYGGQQPDFYGQDGYPPPQRPQYRQQPQRPQQAQQPLRSGPQGPADWDADPFRDDSEHAFFSDGPAEDDTPADRCSQRRGGKDGGRKRRSGAACLVVLLVLGGGIAGIGYFGYQFYENRFGPVPDFPGQGKGEMQVEIPDGATGNLIGNILKKAGVVKSVGAFTAAAQKNPKANSIQPGIYVLRKEMSAEAAVTMMLNPSAQNALIIPEGWRATRVYEAIDKKLGLKTGTTRSEAKNSDLGLPSWANGKIEGFLFPSKYSFGKSTKPADMLKRMVRQAEAEYQKDDMEAEAKKAGMTPYQVVTLASLIQAEAQGDDEFGKVSRVIYNRLDKGMRLQFDSTINYAMGRATLDTSVGDTQYQSEYNTYLHTGLTPTPINNPGHQAIEAALHPTKGDWLFFVTVKPGDTRFTDSQAVHDQSVRDFNDYQYQRKHGG